MPTKVKICGLRDHVGLEAALAGAVDFIGLVSFPKSPRHVEPAEAGRLADQARGASKIVALTVDPDDGLLETLVRMVSPDYLQLHGAETPERVEQILLRFEIPVIKAVKVETREDAAVARHYEDLADLLLFDAKPPRNATLPGGNGIPFDWRALEGFKGEGDFMLSGGLTPENVQAAVEATGAPVVDVSSGVESAPGVKDPRLIASFLQRAKAAGG